MANVDFQQLRRHTWLNRLQSLALIAVLAGFLALLGWLLWGADGLLGLLLGGAMAMAVNPRVSPHWVMALYGARRISERRAPGLCRCVGELARRAGLQYMPGLYYIPSQMVNAFAVGTRARAAIGLTDGLLRSLGEREVAAVLAHEISHIRNNDLWVMGLADLVSSATRLLSWFGVVLLVVNLPLILLTGMAVNWLAIALLIFAPALSVLAQLALSRTREYDADMGAVALTGDPRGLANALAKIERLQGGLMERLLFPGRGEPDPSLLRTHPHTEDRIVRLLSLEPGALRPLLHWHGEVEGLGLSGRRPPPPKRHLTGLWY